MEMRLARSSAKYAGLVTTCRAKGALRACAAAMASPRWRIALNALHALPGTSQTAGHADHAAKTTLRGLEARSVTPAGPGFRAPPSTRSASTWMSAPSRTVCRRPMTQVAGSRSDALRSATLCYPGSFAPSHSHGYRVLHVRGLFQRGGRVHLRGRVRNQARGRVQPQHRPAPVPGRQPLQSDQARPSDWGPGWHLGSTDVGERRQQLCDGGELPALSLKKCTALLVEWR